MIWVRDISAGLGFVAFSIACLYGLGPAVETVWAIWEMVVG